MLLLMLDERALSSMFWTIRTKDNSYRAQNNSDQNNSYPKQIMHRTVLQLARGNSHNHRLDVEPSETPKNTLNREINGRNICDYISIQV